MIDETTPSIRSRHDLCAEVTLPLAVNASRHVVMTALSQQVREHQGTKNTRCRQSASPGASVALVLIPMAHACQGSLRPLSSGEVTYSTNLFAVFGSFQHEQDELRRNGCNVCTKMSSTIRALGEQGNETRPNRPEITPKLRKTPPQLRKTTPKLRKNLPKLRNLQIGIAPNTNTNTVRCDANATHAVWTNIHPGVSGKHDRQGFITMTASSSGPRILADLLGDLETEADRTHQQRLTGRVVPSPVSRPLIPPWAATLPRACISCTAHREPGRPLSPSRLPPHAGRRPCS